MWKSAPVLALVLVAFALTGCVDDNKAQVEADPKPSETQDPEQVTASAEIADAGSAEETPEPTLAIPETGTHLDPADTDYQPVLPNPFSPAPPTRRENKQRSIELVLRSSPPGARASVDGKYIGVTPTYWSGKADGKSHEFTFVKEQYSVARYRFVATQSGVVHGTLAPLRKVPDAGTAESTKSETR